MVFTKEYVNTKIRIISRFYYLKRAKKRRYYLASPSTNSRITTKASSPLLSFNFKILV